MKAKRLISIVLALALIASCFTVVGLTAFAAEDDSLILNFDFNDYKDGSITDTVQGLTVTSSNGTTDGRESGDTAMLLEGSKETFTWMASDFDPLAQSQNGITITMWLKNDTLASWRHVFNYGNSTNGFSGNYVFLQKRDGGGVRINTSFNDTGDKKDKQVGENLSGAFTSAGVGQWKMITFTEDGNANWKVYEDNALVASWNGSDAGARSVYDINSQVNKVDEERGSVGARYSLFAPQSALWDNDPGIIGAVQSFSIYNVAKSGEDIAAMYNNAMGADTEAINNAISLIDAAVAAENGSDAQLSAYQTAKAAYDALNAYEKTFVTNAESLNTVKDAYVAATGIIMGFDFNGNYDEILGRTTIRDYKGHDTMHETYLELDGEKTGFWEKTGGIYRRDYAVLSQATDGITIEMSVFANSFSEGGANNIFSYTHGTDRLLKLMVTNGGVPAMEMKHQDAAPQLIRVDAESAIPANEWVDIALTQSKADDIITTILYVNGDAVITSTDFPSFSVLDRSGTEDDVYFIGASDFDDRVFGGFIDYCYVYNYAKTYEGDYTAVNSAVDAASALNQDDYTAASWAVLQETMDSVVYDLSASHQDEIDAMAAAITDAINGLIEKKLEINIGISDGVVSDGDSGKYNITWNANVGIGEDSSIDVINENVNFKSYGVYYGTSERAVNDLTNGIQSAQAKVMYFANAEDNGTDDIDVYTIFGFRLKGVPEGRSRAAKFFITYEYNGNTYTVFSDTVAVDAVIAE